MASEDREKQSMGASRPLTGSVVVSYGGNMAGGSWFGPLNPMNPVAPPSVKGRVFDFPTGYNQSIRPKAYEPISFEQLRAFSDAYDLLRLVIETRKDQLAKLAWTIQTRDTFEGAKDSKKSRINEIKKAFVRPDRHHFWAEWLRMILEDLFVLDAPAIHRRKTRGGDIYSFDPIDGATIKRVIDDNARTPEPPLPAYQQILKGLPAVNYTTDELIYRPRNPRTHRVYGYSPVEQIVMTVNIALRRQIWQLQSFTEGNIPEALVGVPMTWTPDQIQLFQDQFDAMLEGNTAQRRKMKFVPGEIAKSFFSTKPDKLFESETEEWLARVVCFCFSISPAAFVKMMNRATGESIQEAALEEGLAPIMGWVKSLMDTILIEDFKEEDLEFVWSEEEELDQDVQSQILDREVSGGIQTLNDARKAKGLEPYPDPDADRPMVKTATGYAFVFQTPEEKAAAAAQAPGGSDAPPGDGEVPPGGDVVVVDDDDLSADDEVADHDDAAGGVAEKGDTPFVVPGGAGAFDCCGQHGPRLAKADSSKLFVDPERPAIKSRRKAVKLKVRSALSVLGQSVSKQVRQKLTGMGKADDPEDELDIDALMDALRIEFDKGLEDEIANELAGVYSAAGAEALSQIGKTRDDLVNQVSSRSVKWAEDNAADLVSGVEDATRDMIRATIVSGMEQNLSAEAIGDLLEEGYAFSEDRADLITLTEIATANSMGALAGYGEAKAAGVVVKKSWLILDDACDICQENEDAGAIELEDQFPSGDDSPPGHPNCRCVLVPEVEDENGDEVDAEDAEGEVDTSDAED